MAPGTPYRGPVPLVPPMTPYIIQRRSKFRIARDTSSGVQFWSTKLCDFVGAGHGNWRRRSNFHSREGAEAELKRILKEKA